MSRGATEQVQSASGFTLEDEQANDTGRIPVFHVRSRVRRIYGELQNATEPQDAVNKLIADMMVAAEFGAFKQRYIISQADVSQLRNAPNEIWSIPAGDGDGSESTQVGEFSATELANFTQAVDHWANAMARITRTPAHYFFAQGGNISGDALVAMETPLARKAAKYQERLGACWRDVASYALALNGRDVPAHEIECVWEDVRTVSPPPRLMWSVGSSQPVSRSRPRSGAAAGRKATSPCLTRTRLPRVHRRRVLHRRCSTGRGRSSTPGGRIHWQAEMPLNSTSCTGKRALLKERMLWYALRNDLSLEDVAGKLTIIARDGTPSNGWGEPARKLAWRVSGHLPAFKQSTQPSAALMRALRG